MKVAVDVDNTADAAPDVFQSLLSALKAAGHTVVILTGCSSDTATQRDWDEKAAYLSSLGLGACWDELVVFSSPPHKGKAKWCAKHHVDLLIDNSTKTADLATSGCVVLVPWATRSDKKEH